MKTHHWTARERAGRARAARGFTLVELLIVVAILSLLATMVVPSLGRVRESARTTVCVTNHHVIVRALVSYHSEHGTFPFNYGWYYASNDPARQKWALGYISSYLGGAPNVWNLAYKDEGEFPRAYICPSADLDTVYQYNPSDKYHACIWTNVAIRVNRGWKVGLFRPWYGYEDKPPGWDGDSGGEARFTGLCCPRCHNWRSVYCPRLATVPNPNQTVFSGCTNNDFPQQNDAGEFIAFDSYGNQCRLYCQVYFPGFWHMRPGWGRVTGSLSLDRHDGKLPMSYLDGSATAVSQHWIDEHWRSFHNRPGDYIGDWQIQFPNDNVCSGSSHDRIHPLPDPVVE